MDFWEQHEPELLCLLKDLLYKSGISAFCPPFRLSECKIIILVLMLYSTSFWITESNSRAQVIFVCCRELSSCMCANMILRCWILLLTPRVIHLRNWTSRVKFWLLVLLGVRLHPKVSDTYSVTMLGSFLAYIVWQWPALFLLQALTMVFL